MIIKPVGNCESSNRNLRIIIAMFTVPVIWKAQIYCRYLSMIARCDQHGHLESPLEQTLGGFEADQAAAEDQRFFSPGDNRQHVADVGFGSHVKYVFQIQAFRFDRPGVRARRDQQPVKLKGWAVLDCHLFLIHVDMRDPASQHGRDFKIIVKALAGNGQLPGCGLSGQNHADHGPAVRRKCFIRHHGNAACGIELPDCLGRAHPGDAVSQNYMLHDTPLNSFKYSDIVDLFIPALKTWFSEPGQRQMGPPCSTRFLNPKYEIRNNTQCSKFKCSKLLP